MATLNFGLATTNLNATSGFRTRTKSWSRGKSTIVCIGGGPIGPLDWVT